MKVSQLSRWSILLTLMLATSVFQHSHASWSHHKKEETVEVHEEESESTKNHDGIGSKIEKVLNKVKHVGGDSAVNATAEAAAEQAKAAGTMAKISLSAAKAGVAVGSTVGHGVDTIKGVGDSIADTTRSGISAVHDTIAPPPKEPTTMDRIYGSASKAREAVSSTFSSAYEYVRPKEPSTTEKASAYATSASDAVTSTVSYGVNTVLDTFSKGYSSITGMMKPKEPTTMEKMSASAQKTRQTIGETLARGVNSGVAAVQSATGTKKKEPEPTTMERISARVKSVFGAGVL
jgi:hypothetical protein